jgi:hypothetical protein
MTAVSETTYELPLLMKIALIMKDSQRPKGRQAARVSYVGPRPDGVADIYFDNFGHDRNTLKVRFSEPVDFKRLGEIGENTGYHVMSSPAAPELQTHEIKVFDQSGELIKTEPHEQIRKHDWFHLTRSPNEGLSILEGSAAAPEIVSLGTDLKLRWPGKGPVSNPNALEILEQYRKEIYE